MAIRKEHIYLRVLVARGEARLFMECARADGRSLSSWGRQAMIARAAESPVSVVREKKSPGPLDKR